MPTAVEATTLSNLKVDDAVTKAFDGAVTPEDIRRVIDEEAAKQNITIPRDGAGRFTSPKPAETAKPTTTPTETTESKEDDGKFEYTDTFVIGGKSYTFEGDTPADINRQVKAAMATHEAALQKAKEDAAPKVVVDPKKQADEKAKLQLDFATGKISIDEYLEKSGALDKYLEKKGLKVDELKQTLEESKEQKEVNSWKAATKEFLEGENGWPGGEQNMKVMGYKLAELGLDSTPSVESFQKAFAAMKTEGLVFPVEAPAEDGQNTTTTTTTTTTATAAAPPAKKKLEGSGVFGVRGGDSRRDANNGKPNNTPKVPEITADMSPAAIMELYKNAAIASGQHPDELLRQSHARK